MRKILVLSVLVSLNAGMIFGQTASSSSPVTQKAGVTILEFGSQCTPCKIMKVILTETEKKYQGRVSVNFYDVNQKTEMLMAQKFKVRSIPTQIFLNAQGLEYERHSGILSSRQVELMIEKGGITNGHSDKSI